MFELINPQRACRWYYTGQNSISLAADDVGVVAGNRRSHQRIED